MAACGFQVFFQSELQRCTERLHVEGVRTCAFLQVCFKAAPPDSWPSACTERRGPLPAPAATFATLLLLLRLQLAEEPEATASNKSL